LVKAGAEAGSELRAAGHQDDPPGAMWCNEPPRLGDFGPILPRCQPSRCPATQNGWCMIGHRASGVRPAVKSRAAC